MDATAAGTAPHASRYVRVLGLLESRYVEFEFSIGDPELAVELVLAFPQFQEFCRRNRVRMVGAEEAARLDLERMKWRYGSPGLAE